MGKVFLPTSKPAVTTTARPSRGNSPTASNETSVLSDSGLSSTGVTYTAAAVGVGGLANYKNAANVSADESGGPSLANSTSVSAREARSRRRQSIIDDVKVKVVPRKPTKQMSKRKLAGAAAQARKSKRQRYDKNCVAIKFLTGTLYLYRGPQRRAEFVRSK